MNFLNDLGSRFKIGTRIGGGFMLIIALLAVVATAGYFGLDAARIALQRYDLMSSNTLRLVETEREFVGLRRNVLAFVQRGDQASQNRVHELTKHLDENFKKLDENLILPEVKESVRRAAGLVDQYVKNFEVIVKNSAARDRSVNEQTNPVGAKMRTLITEIIDSA
ncbi:MAG: hypothetical protein HY056_00510, partial [Proteobacteria bacterium]|nr:hypothetical protein [Pseudomonadota bacterium]